MGKSSPKPPAPPDPVKMATAQTGSNINTASASAALNAVNQQSPFGTVNYDQTGSMNIGGQEVPRWTQTTTLSPQEQAMYDKQNAVGQQALDAAGQTIGQAQQTLSTPFTLNNLPPLNTGVGTPSLNTSYATADPRVAPAAGPIQKKVGNAGPMQKDLPLYGQQTKLASAGPTTPAAQPTGQQTSFANAGPLNMSVTPTGQQTGFASAQPIQQGIGANDFSADRQRVEDAFLSRFDTDMARREQSTQARLMAQGLQPGTEAYGTEMELLGRARNDARTQAILAGGQEQSRLFGLEQAQGQFANQAQGQQFGQNLTQGQFGNDARQRAFEQAIGAGNFGNQAQGQQFGQNLTQGQFANQALDTLYGQRSSSVDQANNIQNQNFGQNLASGQFTNQANTTMNNTNLAAMDARNRAQAQQYGQLLSSGNFANQAQNQAFGQGLAATDQYNQAAGQFTGQNAALAAFGNTAGQQGFDMNMQNAAFGNQARQQSIAEQQLLRSQPINEVSALLGLGPGVQMPTGAPNFGVNVGNTDVLGAYGMQQAGLMNNYNQQMQQKNAMWGALGNLGGLAAGAAIGKWG